jgi:hypothetical protein
MARALRHLAVLIVAGLACASTAAARTVKCRSTNPVSALTTDLPAGLPGEYAAPHKLLAGCQVAETISTSLGHKLVAHKKIPATITLQNTPSPGEPGHQSYVFVPYLAFHKASDSVTGTVFCSTRPTWYIRFTVTGPHAPR